MGDRWKKWFRWKELFQSERVRGAPSSTWAQWLTLISSILAVVTVVVSLVFYFIDSSPEATSGGSETPEIGQPLQPAPLTASSGSGCAMASLDGLLLAGNNPKPTSGAPHGGGISHRQYPQGYRLDDRFQPTFNSYIDDTDCSPKDERAFMGARVTRPRPEPPDSFETRRKLRVRPGDEVLVSMYVNNDGSVSDGPDQPSGAAAHGIRAGVSFPTDETGRELQIGTWLYADDAIVNAENRRLRSISDNMSLLSETGRPIRARYIDASSRLLQSNQSRDPMSRSYQVWQLSQHQEFLLQSVTREQVDGNSELDPKTGLPIGNDGTFEAGTAVGDNVDQRLDWNAGTQSHGYVQFRLQVEGAG